VAEVSLEDGKVRVHRVVCAADAGTVVNPDIIKAQITSAIIFGLSAALDGEISWKDGRVEQGNYDSYKVLRMKEAPTVEVYLVGSKQPPGGVGEPGTPPIAPPVLNALFALTGTRVRKLPIDAAQLKTA
jgi:isoquinoline 1-oxidoreductase beta subunit